MRPSIASYGDFSLDKGRSPGFASGASDCSPSSDSLSLRLTRLKRLTSPDTPTRRLIMQKARRRFRSDRSWTHGFRFFFNPLPGCFSPFPHGTIRYRSSGTLLRWRLKRDRLPVRGCHPLCRRFPDGFPFPRAQFTGAPTTPGRPQPPRFGLFPFRSPLLGESMFLSFPAGIEMFQFPALAPLAGCAPSRRAGCPIRTPPDQFALAAPGSFAARRVLRRLRKPRHPPCALLSFVSCRAPVGSPRPARSVS